MIGRTLSSYEIVAEIGAGAMGQVWLARDTGTGRRVALKFVSGPTPSDEQRERLRREAAAAARLNHPGIVSLFALEESEDQLFLVQEFVDGESLGRRLGRGPLGPNEVARLARELASALAHAHAQGVLHRDLKPENVLIAADGHYKIADFGIARLEDAPTITDSGVVIGSVPYLAPERLRGARGDARSDLFALGAILYEAAAGRRAFAGATEAEAMFAVLNEDPPPLPTSPALAPVADLVTRLLSKEPTQRPPSAEAVAATLEGIQTAARPSARSRRVWPVAAAAIAIAALGLWLLWSRVRAPASPADQPAIAVLYFENMADPADPGRIGPITGNLLITALAQSPAVNVLSTQRVLDAMRQIGAAGAMLDRRRALEIARRVHASRIITGSILQTQPFLIMTAEVSDVTSGRVLSAVRLEGQPGQSVFQVVDALSSRLTAGLPSAVEARSLAPVAQRTSTDLEAQREYVEGVERLAHGNIPAARVSFLSAVRRDSTFAQALYQLALTEWWGNEPVAAGASIAAALQHADRLPPLEREIVKGLELLVTDRIGHSLPLFERLAREYPDEKLVQYGLVEASLHTGEFATTLRAAERARALDPDFTLAAVHQVDALRHLGRFAEAERTAEDALTRDPKNGLLWESLFQTHVRRGDGRGALEVAERAAANGSIVEFEKIGAALLAISSDDLGAARRLMVRTRPASGLAKNHALGLEYWSQMRRGSFRRAERIAERAWSSPPKPGRVPLTLANGVDAAIAARDSVGAERFAGKTAAWLLDALGPTFSFAAELIRLTTMLNWGWSSGSAAAMERAEHIAARDPRYYARSLRFTHGLALAAQGRYAAALDSMRGGEYPGWPVTSSSNARFEIARTALAAGLPGEALGTLDTLIGAPVLLPADAVRLHFYRAQALEKLGRPAEAVAAYRVFLALWKDADPDVPEVSAARAAVARLQSRASRDSGGPL